MPVKPRNVLLVEDVTEMRAWMCEVVDTVFPLTTIQEAATVEAARGLLEEQSFELALFDINLPDGDGIELLGEASQRYPQMYSVIISAYGDDKHLFDALRAGAKGYLLKEQSSGQLIRQLQGILDDQPPLSPAIARRVLKCFSPAESNNLTPRELQVLTLIAQGLRVKDVAAELSISEYTAGDHVKNIYNKLNVNNRSEATLQAVKLGLI